MRKLLLLLSLPLLFSGCGPQYVLKMEPTIASAENDYFKAEITPSSKGMFGYESFLLNIHNKTEQNLELIWDKTLFIENGQTSGGFMFEGVVYKDRNNPKPPDIIFANSKFSKTIWPNNYVYFSSGRYGGWGHYPMPLGDNGIYLTIKAGEKDINEKLIINISKVKKPEL